MSRPALRDITLTAEQYDICWADLGLGEHVYPLEVRGHGRTYEERAERRRRVYDQLGARGLARGQTPEPTLAEALTLLARAQVWLDMTWMSELVQTEVDRAVAARSGEHGLVARLDASGLRLMPRRGASLLLALIDQLPSTGPASGPSLSLPQEMLQSEPTGQSGDAVTGQDTAMAESYRREYRALEELLSKPRVRGGQIVANVRDRTGKRHRSRPVHWFDTASGRWTARVLPAPDGREHLTVAPADSKRIATQISELLDRLMR